ncbi:hypothetical protein ACXR2U_19555 [Jatrophihabitans sp. YIM 134969]
MTGRGGVPATGVGAVVLNLTATGATAAGYVTAYPAGTDVPVASNLNHVKGRPTPNLVTVEVGADGVVDLLDGPRTGTGSLDLVADVFGYYRDGIAAAAGAFVPVDPARVLDTRAGLGAPKGQLAGGAAIALQVTGRGGVRDSGVAAVVLNVTATGARGAGYVTAYPGGDDAPTTSSVNYAAGQTVANLVTVGASDGGTVALRNGRGGGTAVDLIVDVAGYYLADTSFRWGSPTKIDNDGTGLSDVSCPTATFCAAGDAHNVAFWDGTSWGEPLVANQQSLQSLVCTSPSFCVAGDLQGDVVVWDGTSWSAARHVSVNNGIGGYIDALQCPDATTCIAVDNSGRAFTSHDGFRTFTTSASANMGGLKVSCPTATFCAAGDYDGRVAIFDGTVWSPPLQTAFNYISDVSCASATFCTAVSESGSYVWNGSGWSMSTLSDSKSLRSVVCAAATSCLAGDAAGRVLRWNGTSWSGPVAVTTSVVSDLACAGASNCWAVDYDGAGARFDGTTWSPPQEISPLGGSLRGISCVSEAFCVAVDSSYLLSRSKGHATVYGGTSWSELTVVTNSQPLAGVSCASATYCVAITERGQVSRFDGKSWSKLTGTTLSSFTSTISCPTDAFCAAGDQSGGISFSDGTRWKDGGDIAHFESGVSDVSCPAAGTCVAVGGNGNAAVYRNGAWEPTRTVDEDHGLQNVSCPSVTVCVAADRVGDVFDWDGTSWSPAVSSGDPDVNALSCASAALCVLVDSTGRAAVRQGGTWSAPVLVDSGSGGQTPYLTGVSCIPGGTTCTAISTAGNAIRGG